MVSRFEFDLADDTDNKRLRQRMAEDFMPGKIAVSFRREPDYFSGAVLQGEQAQIIKCTDKQADRLVGLAARVTLDTYINGGVHRVGYLSDLRCDKKYRSGTLLARGYRYLNHLHQSDPVPWYYTVIYDGNDRARDMLTSTRAGLPEYKSAGKVLTPAIMLMNARRLDKMNGVTIMQANTAQLAEVFTFINQHYKEKQFAPVYRLADWGTPRLGGLNCQDIYLAIRDNHIVGVAAAWDQSHCRQTHVEAYCGAMRFYKPVYNVLSKVLPIKRLPEIGGRIPYLYLSLVAIKGNDVDIFRQLMAHIYNDRRAGNWHYLIPGIHEDDPLAEVLDDYRRIEAHGNVYLVQYDNAGDTQLPLDNRLLHIEAATL